MSNINPTGLDAFKPSEIANLVENAGVAKVRLSFQQVLVLAILAGVFIALGSAAYTAVMTGADASFGPSRLLGGVVFSLGLILVIVGGAELFTGNALMVMAAVDGKIKPSQLMASWAVVYIGNFAGAAGIAWGVSLAAAPIEASAFFANIAVVTLGNILGGAGALH